MDIDPKFVKLKKVNGYVWLSGNKWTEIPTWLKNIEITGYFDCSCNKLTTLKNCPQKIRGSFYCCNNLLNSIEGCPENIKVNFDCTNNNLISLEGCPKNIEGNFYCDDNKVKLELPDYVKIRGEFKN
jgi:Leucine-rich repeat (LRR) protein